ncbi:MAG: hypothetical protein HQL52_17055 [Magnetococcales bacterium]|nr:hypothetical protein [Magnetococcales bacterium]
MESIEVAKIKIGQTVTLEFGNKEAILTKLEEPNKFNVEDWFYDEEEIYILESVIEEDEPLHYTREAFTGSLEEALKADEGLFGNDRKLQNFLGRTVDGIEMEEEEEEEAGESEG